MSFKKNKYVVCKNAISKEIASFCFDVLKLRNKALASLYDSKDRRAYDRFMGTFGDTQIVQSNAYCVYGDPTMETLLLNTQKILENETKLKLIPTYSYARIYCPGDKLKRHKDRPSCEISTTINLGGDPWPIYIDPTGENYVIDEFKEIHKPNAPKGIAVNLEPGDMLIYSGCELEHWREPFTGEICGQVFLHYNRKKKKNNNLYDGRPYLGMFKNV